VTEKEADKILLLLDPLASMAGTNAAALNELLRGVATGEQSLAAMLEDMAANAGIIPVESSERDEEKPKATECRCPKCGALVEGDE
jgi:hypothetical protein